MSFVSVILFFVYCYGLGLTISSFVKNSENFFERNLMRLGFGLSLLPFLALILNIIKIPADWRILLIISLIFPIFYLIRNYRKFNFFFKLTKSNLSIFIMLIIFLINFYIYVSGAFNYPYLEDDDPWAHAHGVKYISVEKNAFDELASRIRYVNPYPPTYDMLMGILHQTNDSVYWTLKFFNALIISLSTIFFYFWVRELTQNVNKALFATFALMSIPAFMSHFIWGISLSVPLYFVVFYAIERIKYDNKWSIVAALTMVTVLISSPTHSAYFGLLLIVYVGAKIILERKILFWHIGAGVLGLGISFLLWWFPMLLRHGFEGTLSGIGFAGFGRKDLVGGAFRGTGDRVYTFSDFFIAQKQNMINNPIGIGIVLSILTIIALVFVILKFKDLLKKENHWLGITLALFIFTFYAVNAANFTIKLSPFRAWMLLAIPVCILAAHGAFNLMTISKKSMGNIGKYAILIILIAGIYFTSTQQKIAVNTATWPPGAFWTSGDEIGFYVWMRDNLPKNSKVFTFKSHDQVIGMDMFICKWCDDVSHYQQTGYNQTPEDTYSWMKKSGYEFLVIDGISARKFGQEVTNNKIRELTQSGLFRPVFQNQGAILFEI